VSTDGIGVAVGGDLHGTVTVSPTVIQENHAPSLANVSVTPPFDLLPVKLHGREDLVDDLVAEFQRRRRLKRRSRGQPKSTSMWVLHGLGGIGKSTVALAVARKMSTSGVRCFWVSATDKAGVQAGMWRVARDLAPTQMRLAPAPTEAGAVDVVWRILEEARSDWLLVLDNLDPQVAAADGQKTEAGNGWIRATSRGIVVVTSRVDSAQVWGQGAVTRRLDPLHQEAGSRLLLDLASPQAGTNEEAKDLAARLGGLPLALKAAGRYLHSAIENTDTICTFSGYQHALDQRFAKIIDRFATNSMWLAGSQLDPRELVMGTWQLSLDYLKERGFPEAEDMLRVLSCYALAPIPLVLVAPSASDVNTDARDTKKAAAIVVAELDGRMLEVAAALRGLGLLDRIGPNGPESLAREREQLVVLHPLVRDVMVEMVNAEPQLARNIRSRALAGLIAAARAGLKLDERARFSFLRSIEPHLKLTARFAAENFDLYPNKQLREFAALLGQLAAIMRMHDWATRAVAQDSLYVYRDFTRRVPGRPARLAQKSLSYQIGRNLWEPGRYESAIVELKHSLRPLGRLLMMTGSIGRTIVLTNLGLSLTGPDAENQRYMSQAMLRMMRHLPGNRSNKLRTQESLATVLDDLGDVKGAESQHRALLQARRRDLGDEHPATLVTRHHLADTLREAGRADEAESEHRAVLETQRRVVGEEHPATLATWGCLATDVWKQGRAEEAESEYRAVLEIQRRVLGEEHQLTLITRHNRASVLWELNRVKEAKSEYQALLEIQQRVLGDHHSETLLTREHKAGTVADQGDLRAAESEYRAVLQIKRKVLGEEHPSVLATRGNLGRIVAKRGDLKAAASEYRAVLEILRRILGGDHPDTLTAQHNLASVIAQRGRVDEAEAEYGALLEIQRRVLGDHHPLTVTTRQALDQLRRPRLAERPIPARSAHSGRRRRNS
jgi:tetratricopeptide (TPR) repeat protein